MARHPTHSDTAFDSHDLRSAPRRFAATCPERPIACDDDDRGDDTGDEDWDGCEVDPMTDPFCDPFGLDDDEPQPEYGDFWDEPDERED
jgi:hypothetical protein